MSAKLVSLIGPPAVGKTTLAEALATELPAELVREDYADNLFLADSYAGQEAARLPGQLYFLVSRVGQLLTAHWPATGVRVSDYGFCQDRIYARARLAEADYRVYESVAGRLEMLVRRPDLLVHLDACEQTLLDRIAARGRAFERAIDRRFLTAMRQAYRRAAAEAACPVVGLDCDASDLRDASVRAGLVCRLREMLCA